MLAEWGLCEKIIYQVIHAALFATTDTSIFFKQGLKIISNMSAVP